MAGLSVRAWLAQQREALASIPRPSEPREPQTHDYVRQTWGHAVSVRKTSQEGRVIEGHLFSSRPVRTGDYLLLPNGDATTRYRIVGELDNPFDPGDMYFFTAEFAPRES